MKRGGVTGSFSTLSTEGLSPSNKQIAGAVDDIDRYSKSVSYVMIIEDAIVHDSVQKDLVEIDFVELCVRVVCMFAHRLKVPALTP